MSIPTIKTLLASARRQLTQSTTPRLDAELLMAHILFVSRSTLLTRRAEAITPNQMEQFQALVLRRAQGEPIAYLVRKKEFWSLPLKVTQDTLVPRPETECLVEAVLQFLGRGHCCVADLGTGTGAIALALATERPGWQVIATDISEKALEVASENAKQLGCTRPGRSDSSASEESEKAKVDSFAVCRLLENSQSDLQEGSAMSRVPSNLKRTRLNCPNVEFRKGHWLDIITEPLDAIVSNPPYIAEDDPHLTGDGVAFEPKMALVAAKNGLAALKEIIENAPKHLKDGGYLFLEHGIGQAPAVKALLKAAGYTDIESIKDYSGVERIIIARKRAISWSPPLKKGG